MTVVIRKQTLNESAVCAAGVLLLLLAYPGFADDRPRVLYFQDNNAERKPLHTVVPEYPRRARRERLEGEVQVCFNVDHFGETYRISVRKSTHRIFEKPAIRAVRESTYQPLTPDQKLPGIKTCRTFRFILEPVDPAEFEIPRDSN